MTVDLDEIELVAMETDAIDNPHVPESLKFLLRREREALNLAKEAFTRALLAEDERGYLKWESELRRNLALASQLRRSVFPVAVEFISGAPFAMAVKPR